MASELTIPAGTILYRSQPNICEGVQKRLCSNTGKVGVYFSTLPFLSMAMVLEYHKNMDIGVFVTQSPIRVYEGKYSKHAGNASHIDKNILPILDMDINTKFNIELYNHTPQLGEGEVFLTQDSDLKNVQLVETYTIDYKEFKKAVQGIYDRYGVLPLSDFNFYLENAGSSIQKIKCSGFSRLRSYFKRGTRRRKSLKTRRG